VTLKWTEVWHNRTEWFLFHFSFSAASLLLRYYFRNSTQLTVDLRARLNTALRVAHFLMNAQLMRISIGHAGLIPKIKKFAPNQLIQNPTKPIVHHWATTSLAVTSSV
jgi:hypothetical protein